MKISYYEFDDAELTAHGNNVKELLLMVLQKDGVIEDATKLSEEYAIILVKPGMFGAILDKFWGNTKNAKWQVVRTIK